MPFEPVLYASRSQRLLGQLLDGLVGASPLILAAILSSFNDSIGSTGAMLGIAWMIFYYFLSDGLPDGQSLAKRWLGMRVVSARTGAPCGFGQSILRNLLLAILGPLDWIFIFGDQHQRLGDMAAGTIVVSVPRSLR